MKNGTVCLFDTKTRGSDPDAPAKNNALYNYMQEFNARGGRQLIGGVLIYDEASTNWYYPGGIIDNTESIAGWSVLDLRSV